MYQGVLNARQHMYDMALKGLDSVLNSVDPLTMAKRREAILNAQYQSKLLPMQLQYMEQYGMPMPKTPQEAIAFQNYQNQRNQAANMSNIRGMATGGGGVSPYSQPSAGTWDQTTGTMTVPSPTPQYPKASVTVGPIATDEEPPTQPTTQTISGGRLYDDQGNVLPPEQQGVPYEEGIG